MSNDNYGNIRETNHKKARKTGCTLKRQHGILTNGSLAEELREFVGASQANACG